MPTNLNKKLLDLKTWDMCAPATVVNSNGMFTISSDGPDQGIMYVTSATSVLWYYPHEDGWLPLASPALTGTFGAGACGKYHPTGPSMTAQAGTGAGILVTNLTLLVDLSPKNGKKFAGRITSGTGAGQDFVILSNTSGVANSALTVVKPDGVTALTTAPDTTSVFTLFTGRFYILSAGTLAAGSFKYYDYATQTWGANLSIVNLPATWATEGRMSATPGNAAIFASGTATAGAASTLTNSAKTWAVNQWANFQIRITAGTGAGQVRSIASNTATAVTTSAVWTTNPDTTSVYAIEGNDDSIYVAGNATLTLYKYSISANTWTVLAPGVARGGVTGLGFSMHWVPTSTASGWSNESAIINGRRLYSFRGASTNILDVYDIASNAWSSVTYGRQTETIGSGAGWGYDGADRIICQISPTANVPARFVAFDLKEQGLVPITPLLYYHGVITTGDKMSIIEYNDGAGSPLKFIYILRHSGSEMFRMELF